jgi:hypothetical protein
MNDIEKKIEDLKVDFLGKLEALRKKAEAQKRQEEWKPWKPEVEEKYFYIGNTLETGKYFNGGYPVDDKLITVGNCFRTKERAEQVAKKMRLLLQLEQLHDQLCPDYEPDYEDDDEVKFYVYFGHSQGRYDISRSISWENPCMVAFDTEENAEKAAKILNKEMRESK